MLNQLAHYASLSLNIYIVVDPTLVDIGNASHAGHCIVRPQCLHNEFWWHAYFKNHNFYVNVKQVLNNVTAGDKHVHLNTKIIKSLNSCMLLVWHYLK